MTDNELIFALENKVNGSDYHNFEDYELLDLIYRLNAKIENLQRTETEVDNFCRRLCRMRMLNGNRVASYEDLQRYIQGEKTKAVKEFAEKLKGD